MGQTVLVADDSPSIQNKAKGILTGEGLEVVTVSNGVAAIKKLPVVKPVVILADVSMPGKDGYEVCEFVKNSAEFSHVPVVLVFSDMEPYDEARGARVRADGTIRKKAGVRDPFDHEELISTVAKFVAQAEAAVSKPEVVAPPPAPTMVTEPVDLEPQITPREVTPELGALSEGVAFAEPVVEGVPAVVPEVAPPEVAAAEPSLPAAFEAPAPAVEPVLEAEAAVEPQPAFEPPLAEAEVAPVVPPAVEEVPLPSEPVLIEEAAPAAFALPPPFPERTMVFRAPVEIAEPVLSDELAPSPPLAAVPEVSPPAIEPAAEAAEAEAAAVAAPEEVPVPATSLESFSLAEATAGQVRFAQAEAVEAGPEAAPAEVAAPAAAPALDANLIQAVVSRVVLKMWPPALPPETMEDLVKKLTEEVIAELSSGPSTIQ